MSELDILYDHYKDSFSYLRDYLKQRDKLTVYCAIAIGILFLSFFLPSDFENISKTLLEKKLTIELSDLKIIETFILFVLLLMVMKYFQINIFIERQYDYIQRIEKDLTANLNNFKIEREGKAYLKYYPLILGATDKIYKWGFPLLLVTSLIFKWIEGLNKLTQYKFFCLFTLNSVVILGIIILTFLYLSWIHFHDFKRK
jgi:hypothetical protein